MCSMAPDGSRDEATVFVRVFHIGNKAAAKEIEPGDGFAKDDSTTVLAWRSKLVPMDKNDEVTRKDGAKVVKSMVSRSNRAAVEVADGRVVMTGKGTLNFSPDSGLQMEPVWLPPPEAVVKRLVEISKEGYQNFTLWEHLGWSLYRVVLGFFLGAIVGIPLGYAMGLSDWFRGWFDPIVEFMRPVPPLALIPLVIIWAGIGETGKIILLFLASLWIMTIAARAGVSGVQITKVHCGLLAGRKQVATHALRHHAKLAAGNIYRRAGRHGRLLGYSGRGGTGRRRERRRHDDHGGVAVSAHRHRPHGYHSDRRYRLRKNLIDILQMRKCEDVLVPWKGKGSFQPRDRGGARRLHDLFVVSSPVNHASAAAT